MYVLKSMKEGVTDEGSSKNNKNKIAL